MPRLLMYFKYIWICIFDWLDFMGSWNIKINQYSTVLALLGESVMVGRPQLYLLLYVMKTKQTPKTVVINMK